MYRLKNKETSLTHHDSCKLNLNLFLIKSLQIQALYQPMTPFSQSTNHELVSNRHLWFCLWVAKACFLLFVPILKFSELKWPLKAQQQQEEKQGVLYFRPLSLQIGKQNVFFSFFLGKKRIKSFAWNRNPPNAACSVRLWIQTLSA